ncbi:protein rep, partial [Aerococcus christensenii]|uniref:protein rep n=1 Tax=Aerococcus christensenii TaxID=87541 RepID=UPI00254C99D9
HALLFVRSSYFKNSDNYISQGEWAELWQKALKEDYTPVVDVRAVKPKKGVKAGENALMGAAQEVAKYPVKSVDYLTNDYEKNLKRVEDLEKGLKQKRLISYGGLFKDIRNELQLKDVETDDDLIRTDADEEKEATTGEQIIAYWNWQRKNYYVK